MIKSICISEHEEIDRDKLGKDFFAELCEFAENNKIVLKIIGKDKLKATQYVGIIQTKSGVLEILPKIYDDKTKQNEQKAKNLLIKMLRCIKNAPFQNLNANLNTSKMPLLEIFAIGFLDELDTLLRHGLKSKYVSIEDNRKYLKGKLLHIANLRHNLIHKERFYTLSDEYIQDIAQNRILKSTLIFLSRLDFSAQTNLKILTSNAKLEDIPPSSSVEKDFLESDKKSRAFKEYDKLLSWAKVFLSKRSFSVYSGKKDNLALLFDMNEVFESYVANMLRRHTQYDLKTQEEKNIFKSNAKINMRPDIILSKDDSAIAILDTKWKRVESDEKISTSDIYQVFSYGARYKDDKIKVSLIYPKTNEQKPISPIEFEADHNISFFTYFWDLDDEMKNIEELEENIES